MVEYVVKVLQRSQLSHSQTDEKHFIYLHTKWLENTTELQLLLTTNNTCYKAKLCHDEIRSAAEELEQPYNEFFATCKEALTTQMGLPGFDYELDNQEDKFKLFKCTGFETLYMEVPLRKASSCYSLLDAAIENGQRQPTIATEGTASQSETSDSRYKELLEHYEQYIKETKQEEKTMLKKFILLINTKKQRIYDLERKLEEFEHKRADTDSEVEDPPAAQIEDDDVPCFSGATQALTEKDLMQE